MLCDQAQALTIDGRTFKVEPSGCAFDDVPVHTKYRVYERLLVCSEGPGCEPYWDEVINPTSKRRIIEECIL